MNSSTNEPAAPTSSPSSSVISFSPNPSCGVVRTGQHNEDPRQLARASFFDGDITHDDDDDDVCSIDMDALAPYPAYTKSSVEIQEFKELEVSLGENWSLRLAGELSACDMSLDGTIESEIDDERDLGCAEEVDETNVHDVSLHSAPIQDAEDDETRRKRNLLWKQSLKVSMFRK